MRILISLLLLLFLANSILGQEPQRMYMLELKKTDGGLDSVSTGVTIGYYQQNTEGAYKAELFDNLNSKISETRFDFKRITLIEGTEESPESGEMEYDSGSETIFLPYDIYGNIIRITDEKGKELLKIDVSNLSGKGAKSVNNLRDTGQANEIQPQGQLGTYVQETENR